MLMNIFNVFRYLLSVKIDAKIDGDDVYVRKRICHKGYVLLTHKNMFNSDDVLLTEITKTDTLSEIEDYLLYYYNIEVKL